MVPHRSSNLFSISATRACRPRYQTRSATALCKDHTICSLNVAYVWLCITLFISKAHCSNETSPFWVGSLLNVLNFDILPTTWEATMARKYHVVALAFAYVTACLSFPLTQFLLSPPNVTDPPSSPALVWQHCIQYWHSNPTTSWWITMYFIFFQCLHFPWRLTKCSFHHVFALPLSLWS